MSEIILNYCEECMQMTNHTLWRGYCCCNKCKGKPKKAVGILK